MFTHLSRTYSLLGLWAYGLKALQPHNYGITYILQCHKAITITHFSFHQVKQMLVFLTAHLLGTDEVFLTAQLLGSGEAELLLAHVEDGVVLADENVTKDE